MFKKINIISVIVFILFYHSMALGCPPFPTALLTVDSNHVAVNVDITFDGSGSSDTDGPITKYEWDFNYNSSTFNCNYYETSDIHTDNTFDGITTHSFPAPGVYTVALRVTDDSTPAKYDIDTMTVSVGLVKVISGTQERFYSTISDAINAVSTLDGNEVVVYPGIFEESIIINKDITLRSQYNNDWGKITETVIESASDSNAITVTAAGSGCEIYGFTIKNGLRGIYSEGTSSEDISLILGNLIISDNDANTCNGGGIYFEYVDANINNSYIIENEAANGGGIYCENSDLNIANCVFWKNTAKAVSSYGGGLYFVDSDISIDRNTFSKNSSVEYGGAICSNYDSNSSVSVYNSIFWNNTANTTDYDIYNTGSSSISLNRCIISNYPTGSDLLRNSPNFKDEDDIFGSDMIAGTCDDGLRPLPETQAIDASYKTASTPTTDIAGIASIDSLCANTGSGSPDYIDIGAYEVPRIFFVDYNATGANDGNSWDDAYNYLRDALDDNRLTAGDWIFVSAGTYYPDADTTYPNGNDNIERRFDLVDGVYVFGGFTVSAGLHSRDWNSGVYSANFAILDGALNSSIKSKTVVRGADGARLDGFTITNGKNETSPGGGLITQDGDSMLVANCIFKNNRSKFCGGAVYALSDQYEDTVIFENCVFAGNTAWLNSTYSASSGGAVFNDGVKAVFSSCIFNGNAATDGGA
ncbi:MAG TPA: PKD domain-containing protein, partial [Sedimentisphaerales bacterium]|nr:PKD domain-containing protein [Sedimentisphaerales bacterium]